MKMIMLLMLFVISLIAFNPVSFETDRPPDQVAVMASENESFNYELYKLMPVGQTLQTVSFNANFPEYILTTGERKSENYNFFNDYPVPLCGLIDNKNNKITKHVIS